MAIEVQYVLGDYSSLIFSERHKIFDDQVLNFLSDLSIVLRKSSEIRNYPDVANFAFWCRRANLQRISSKYPTDERRVGVGKVFHVTPSNVPINFAFSWALSLLAGNSNIVRLSSKNFEEVNLVIKCIREVLSEEVHRPIQQNNVFIRYEHNEDISKWFMSQIDARVIWGSDRTIFEFKNMNTKLNCRDLFFSTRNSIALIDESRLASLNSEEFSRVVRLFVRDSLTYFQLGCSSPRAVHWLDSTKKKYGVRREFWKEVGNLVQTESLIEPAHAMQRFNNLCSLIARKSSDIKSVNRDFDGIYLIESESLSDVDVEERIVFGTFLEFLQVDLESLIKGVSGKVQTICYFGVDKEELFKVLAQDSTNKVDRIVPFGSAFEISSTWDGFDIIRGLSRTIEVI